VLDAVAERVHVVEHTPRNRCIPPAVDFLKALPHVPVSVGRLWVDAHHVVPPRREQLDEPAVSPAPDLDHSTRRRRQLL
jgi:hypothetical protein